MRLAVAAIPRLVGRVVTTSLPPLLSLLYFLLWFWTPSGKINVAHLLHV